VEHSLTEAEPSEQGVEQILNPSTPSQRVECRPRLTKRFRNDHEIATPRGIERIKRVLQALGLSLVQRDLTLGR
jgi:hypothetical protein